MLKTEGVLTDPASGTVVGRGRAYLHQPRGAGVVGGTMTALVWTAKAARAGAHYRLELSDGAVHDVLCTRCAPTDCGAEVFRFTVAPPAS